ncbi:hypothetical protein HS088_TW16G00049 [Tripterygium wilfordii]|uniref:F-box domain-containing protein n=1 Tax=Tripterygium wilfordii TaxID=458696 RepID=A0A7J7CHV3_TRIWF|nr:F-box protein PP2-B15-like [Tripterygium wilfordii]KAF5733609.1 hypothetical protein HS088_TW16G00049 [Tripterygium wilfordii]
MYISFSCFYTITGLARRKKMAFELLPEDCFVQILSTTTPRDACRASVVSSTFQSLADADAVWDKFLPSDWQQILYRLVNPVEYSSKKDLFLRLCNPQLIDGGRKIFSLEKSTGRKCYVLSARELSITWAHNPRYWTWKQFPESRFPEVAELRTVWWLEINGSINTSLLSPKTVYGAYLILKLAPRAYGLDSLPSEVTVEAGAFKSQGSVYLRREDSSKQYIEQVYCLNRVEALRSRVSEGEKRGLWMCQDGWIEVELGSFYNDGRIGAVKMSLKEVKGNHLKGGLIVGGIEIRPKY